MERELRRYERVAYQSHFCDRCCDYINPGEIYEGRVVITDNHGLLVWKTHVHPICDFPEEPEENELENTKSLEENLKLAA